MKFAKAVLDKNYFEGCYDEPEGKGCSDDLGTPRRKSKNSEIGSPISPEPFSNPETIASP